MKLAERLRALRSESGETQEELAAMLDVRRSTYGEYERGKIRPPSEKLFALAQHYGVTVDYLVGFTEDRQRSTGYGFDVHENITAFVDWLRQPSTVAKYEGRTLTPNERRVLASALEGARHMMDEYVRVHVKGE